MKELKEKRRGSSASFGLKKKIVTSSLLHSLAIPTCTCPVKASLSLFYVAVDSEVHSRMSCRLQSEGARIRNCTSCYLSVCWCMWPVVWAEAQPHCVWWGAECLAIMWHCGTRHRWAIRDTALKGTICSSALMLKNALFHLQIPLPLPGFQNPS